MSSMKRYGLQEARDDLIHSLPAPSGIKDFKDIVALKQRSETALGILFFYIPNDQLSGVVNSAFRPEFCEVGKHAIASQPSPIMGEGPLANRLDCFHANGWESSRVGRALIHGFAEVDEVPQYGSMQMK